jgi:SAM-dependent methyltransferase
LSDKYLSKQSNYNKVFYETYMTGSKTSARHIVPIVMDLIHPKSVIDIGCGVGTWLAVFAENGVKNYRGVDGSWVDKNLLQIPQDHFDMHDLTAPLKADRPFDLVTSLEVAEHLEAKYAETFVDSLTNHGPVILFSAAVPFQGGEHHVNEQWPSYWAELFAKRGYIAVDAIRKRIWQNPDVEWWYAQNVLLFVKTDYLTGQPKLEREHINASSSMLAIIHPRLYKMRCNQLVEEKKNTFANRAYARLLKTRLNNSKK